jgi:hypothetical protein
MNLKEVASNDQYYAVGMMIATLVLQYFICWMEGEMLPGQSAYINHLSKYIYY